MYTCMNAKFEEPSCKLGMVLVLLSCCRPAQGQRHSSHPEAIHETRPPYCLCPQYLHSGSFLAFCIPKSNIVTRYILSIKLMCMTALVVEI